MCFNKRILICLFYIISYYSSGQSNYVLNYSFEQYSSCGEIGNCISSIVTDWNTPTVTYIDWFNTPCHGVSGTAGIPSNIGGYQYARTGVSYAGVAFSETGHYRNYISGRFSDNLIATKKYCVTFYISLGDSTWWSISALGAYISVDSLCEYSFYDTVLHYIPQIENPSSNILSDKIDWVSISGEYQAIGGEKFITIGDFYSDTLSKATYVGNGGTTTGWQSEVESYYYIDDVSVRKLTIANAGKEDTICLGGSIKIGGDSTTPGVSFHWLPTKGLSNPNIAQPYATDSVTTTYTLTVKNDSVSGCNCPDSVTRDSVIVFVKTCVGIDEIKNNEKIKVSPNPSNGLFNISGLSDGMIVETYDYMGRLINTLNTKNTLLQINISDKTNGVYLIRIYTKNLDFVGQRKIIKSE